MVITDATPLTLAHDRNLFYKCKQHTLYKPNYNKKRHHGRLIYRIIEKTKHKCKNIVFIISHYITVSLFIIHILFERSLN